MNHGKYKTFKLFTKQIFSLFNYNLTNIKCTLLIKRFGFESHSIYRIFIEVNYMLVQFYIFIYVKHIYKCILAHLEN